jgi:signal transduction histidine kinase
LAHLRTAYEQKIREAAGLEERHRLARDLHDSIKQALKRGLVSLEELM